MSLRLNQSPKEIVVQSLHGRNTLVVSADVLHVGFTISPDDMRQLVEYWLTNTDLEPDDPRLALVTFVRGLQHTTGHNPGGVRLAPAELIP